MTVRRACPLACSLASLYPGRCRRAGGFGGKDLSSPVLAGGGGVLSHRWWLFEGMFRRRWGLSFGHLLVGLDGVCGLASAGWWALVLTFCVPVGAGMKLRV